MGPSKSNTTELGRKDETLRGHSATNSEAAALETQRQANWARGVVSLATVR